jgi:hydrogenase-1 operon protein HyaF
MTPANPAEFAIAVDAGTHNVQPLLHEIRHALVQLLEDGSETIIDLRSIPLAPGEEAAIEQALGEGEVQATLSALGPSEFRESSYAGVWLVTHYNHDGGIVGKFVEVTRVPSLLKAQLEDIAAGLRVLEERLAEDSGNPAR